MSAPPFCFCSLAFPENLLLQKSFSRQARLCLLLYHTRAVIARVLYKPMPPCYIKIHEKNTHNTFKTTFVSASAADDVYYFFIFSPDREVSGNLSYRISYQIVETKNELLNTGKSYEELAYEAEQIHYYVRKAAHMTEYCLLAVAVSFPFYVYRIRGLRLFLLAGIICVACRAGRISSAFVAGRSPGIRDVGFDSLGALIGILLVQLFCWSTLHAPSSGNKKRRKRR